MFSGSYADFGHELIFFSMALFQFATKAGMIRTQTFGMTPELLHRGLLENCHPAR
jgi:hypothetical protein